MNKILEINNVSLGYKNNFILKNIDITLTKGDFLVIHGKNGSGKTSFLKFLYMKIFYMKSCQLLYLKSLLKILIK